ncbi:Acetyltransferase (GNAT) family protein [Poriferisphaera corsica]|uniref:Acetyltransferase (GNAT) family protein n=1 Tax=Poriferisphaera corsica TaxID=2528020 RepID=A0A517YUP7_9BACT|nr:GNAT family N-acetyltransferase [Poriferisphaera corsica]QDU33935.1 Acetyltransferase (GNAT) family protein [Poriferisphaera corsica]
MDRSEVSAKDVCIERATLEDVRQMYRMADGERWNPFVGIENAVYEIDPRGFWVSRVGDHIIASISVLIYEKFYAFIGLYIVLPEYRGGIIGTNLAKIAIDDARQRGARIFGCDGVPENVKKYEQNGYVFDCTIARYQLITEKQRKDFACESVRVDEVDELNRFLKPYLPEPRVRFVKQWLGCSHVKHCVVREHGEIVGFGSIGPSTEGYRIGPIYSTSSEHTSILINGLLASIEQGQKVIIDVPEVNLDGIALVKRLGMEKIWCFGRMYKGGKPNIHLRDTYATWLVEAG